MSNKEALYDSIPLEKDHARSTPTDKKRLSEGHIRSDIPASKPSVDRQKVGKPWRPKGRK